MKVVLLAGGFGTRISEESQFKPKPMIEIGGMPILWHIMRWYSRFGITEFIVCAGYKQHKIKEFFNSYYLYNSDVTFDFSEGGKLVIHKAMSENWKVTVVDTGLNTMTGGRIKRIKDYVGNEPFMMTYGDGVSNVDIDKLLEFHKKGGRIATLTGVVPEGRFGVLGIDGDEIRSFREKSSADSGWINGGFMVLEPSVFDYIEGDNTTFEREPLEKLSQEGQLDCYRHDGFWQCMDTLRDKEKLEKLLADGIAPWVL
jgi:glucose-1-phosphate cytidylyltransferase